MRYYYRSIRRRGRLAHDYRLSDAATLFQNSLHVRLSDAATQFQDSLDVHDNTILAEVESEYIRQLSQSRDVWAFLTILDPANSGCAYFSSQLLVAEDRPPVHVFHQATTVAEWRSVRARNRRDTKTVLSSVNAFARIPRNFFRVNLIALGNSDHHVPIALTARKALLSSSSEYPTSPVVVQVHDPFLPNLLRKVLNLEHLDWREQIAAAYPGWLESLPDWRRKQIDIGDDTVFVDYKKSCLSALFYQRTIDLVVVHSKAAYDILRSDSLFLTGREPCILFHPVFWPYEKRDRKESRLLRLGSFGVASNAKRLDLVIDVFRMMKAKGEASSLVLAGYGMKEFFADKGSLPEEIEIIDSPSEDKLKELMQSVDIALQFRLLNTGESSGIVPMLLACDVPTICSSVGAFSEYGDAVAFVPSHVSASEVRDVILAEAARDRSRERERFVSARSAAKFWEKLVEAVADLAPSGPAVVVPARALLDHVADSGSHPPSSASATHGAAPASKTTPVCTWPAFQEALQALRNAGAEYVEKHAKRFRVTADALAVVPEVPRGRALELGESGVMAPFLAFDLGFAQVDVTGFRPTPPPVCEPLILLRDGSRREIGRKIVINFEESRFPVEERFYDLVLCCEVIEHLERDPMFLIAEINRILKDNGLLFVSTPNSISAENVFKILHGYAPQFYMQYSSDGSLYRHNFEYAPHQLEEMLQAGGFRIERLWTENTFSRGRSEVVSALAAAGYPADLRGDNIFVIARKEGPVEDRYPSSIYDETAPRLFCDMTRLLSAGDEHTGIHRVTKEVWRHRESAIGPFRHIFPAMFTRDGLTIGKPTLTLEEFSKYQPLPYEEHKPKRGDILFFLDSFGLVSEQNWHELDVLRGTGVRIAVLIHDIFPLTHPEWFPPTFRDFACRWLAGVIPRADVVIVPSRHTANEITRATACGLIRPLVGRIVVVPLGADALQRRLKTDDDAPNPDPVRHAARELEPLVRAAQERVIFLCVGTIELRKGQDEILDACEILWANDARFCMAFVGKEGWESGGVIQRIRSHPRLNRELFYFGAASDRELMLIYSLADCLVQASHDEGFGLPVVEAAAAGCKLLLKDIPIFRELADGHALFVTESGPEGWARGLLTAMRRLADNTFPSARPVGERTWAKSCKEVYDAITRTLLPSHS